MAIKFDRVNPGDLIKAELVNKLLETLEKLDARVTELEQMVVTTGAPVFIDDVSPEGTLSLGSGINIKGRNFSQPAGLNNVTIDGVPIVAFDSFSSTTQMGFTIPETLSITKETLAQLVIINAERGPAGSRMIMLRPKVVVNTGGSTVKYFSHTLESPSSTDPNPVVTKLQTWLFTFNVNVAAKQVAHMLLTPSVSMSGTAGGSAWSAKLLGNNTEVDSLAIDFAASAAGSGGVTKAFAVRVRVPADAPSGAVATVTLTAKETSAETQVTSSNDAAMATVGQKIPDPVSTITLTFLNTSGAASTPQSDSVQFKKGTAPGIVRFSGTSQETGAHTVKVELKDPTGWTVDPSSQSSFNGPGPFSPTAVCTATASAVTPNALLITITHTQKQLTVQYVQPVTAV